MWRARRSERMRLSSKPAETRADDEEDQQRRMTVAKMKASQP